MTDTAKPKNIGLCEFWDRFQDEAWESYRMTNLTPRQLLERVKELTGQSEFQHHQKENMKMTEAKHYTAGIGFHDKNSFIVLKEGSLHGLDITCFYASKNGILRKQENGNSLILVDDDIIVLAGSQETADRVLREIMESDNV